MDGLSKERLQRREGNMKDKVFELINLASAMKVSTLNGDYSNIPSLIEQWQNLVNELEAALYDKHDLDSARTECSELKIEIKELEEKREKL